jgi:hypothetical protein
MQADNYYLPTHNKSNPLANYSLLTIHSPLLTKILPFRQWFYWFVTAGQRPKVSTHLF